MLEKLRSQDRSILFGTQDLHEATQVADVMMLICEGQVFYLGKVSQFLRTNRIGHQLIIRRRNNFLSDAFERLCSLHVTKKDVQLVQKSGKDQFALVIKQQQTAAVQNLIQSMRIHGPSLGFTLISVNLHTIEHAVQNMLAEHRSLECVPNQSGIFSNLVPSSAGLFHVSEPNSNTNIPNSNLKQSSTTSSPPLPEERSTTKPLPTEASTSHFQQIKGYFFVMLHSATSQFRNYYLLGITMLFIWIFLVPIVWMGLSELDKMSRVSQNDFSWKRVGSQPFSLVTSPGYSFADNKANLWSLLKSPLHEMSKDQMSALMLGERMVRAFRPHAEVDVPIVNTEQRRRKETKLLCAKQLLLAFHLKQMEPATNRVRIKNRYNYQSIPSFQNKKKESSYRKMRNDIKRNFARQNNRPILPDWAKKWIHVESSIINQTRWPRNEINPWEFISDLLVSNVSSEQSTPTQLTIIYNARIPNSVLYAQDSLYNSMLMMPQERKILANRSILMKTKPLMLPIPKLNFLYSNMPYRMLLNIFVTLLICWTAFVCNSSLLFLIKNQVSFLNNVK